MQWTEAQALIAQGEYITSDRLDEGEYVGPSANGGFILHSPKGDLDGWQPSLSDQMADTWVVLTS